MAHAQLSAAIGEQLDDLPIDQEVGSLSHKPFVRLCLIEDAASVADALDSEELDDEDIDFLVDQAGLIVSVEKGGAISVRYFEDEDELEDRWNDLCDDLDLDPAERDDDLDETDDEEE